MKRSLLRYSIGAVVLATLVLLAGCGGDKSDLPGQPSGGTGMLRVTVQWPEAGSRVIPPGTTYVLVTVTGAGDDPKQKRVDREAGATQATAEFTNLVPGAKLVVAKAYSSDDEELASGQATATVENDRTTTVSITLEVLTDCELLISQGQALLNEIIAMDPYDEVAGKAKLQAAFDKFTLAKSICNSSQANFGLAISRAALVTQEMVDKYKPVFERSVRSDSGSMVTSSSFWEMPGAIGGGHDPFSSFMSGFASTVRLLQGDTRSPSLQNIFDMQTDLRNVVLPMFAEVTGYLAIVEGDAAFTFGLGATTSPDYVLVDLGDVYLFDGLLRVEKASLALPASYNADYGTFDMNIDTEDRDANSDGLVVVSEYLPPDPFLELSDAAPMQAMKSDLQTACAKAILGIDATLAETSDQFDLIPWHTPGKDVDFDDLNSMKVLVQQIQQALVGPQAVPMIGFEGDLGLVRMYISAWSDNPPADLKAFAPTFHFVDVGLLRVKPGSYPDPTFGGLFPDGLPDEILYGELVPADTGNIGVIIR